MRSRSVLLVVAILLVAGFAALNWSEVVRPSPLLFGPVVMDAPLGAEAPVFQWHSYRFEVPQGAVHLARTESCDAQAFRHGDNAYGFQFHLEMDEPLIERWLANPLYREEIAAMGHTDEAPIRAHTKQYIATMQAQANAVFNNFLDLVGRPQRRYTLPSREWA